ncbi:EthD family reductase [Cytobacillus sp. FSL W7-1323]|uniref:Ethyl tert-butyl ether degradation protein EthD n=1 Tax=Cytobacillus kochii TaxID=859143 RepID=A0A248TFI7_9BACI|nr:MULTISPECIES: EthD family reductase [Cytobacillus]ASV66882.1 ethyl tert-butyl ether degradation protein EthD [Cytobacillus kochii]MCA1024568.1 EthD family reductase [Cytobacillus kochii]MCM3323437.1 EthD family reductase [Cytobacillus kochii]MCM3345832.1 EthD family reductase [Cytobacillus kochii]MDM5206251.1 EthD family reductase [Cytobacillus kochii]
MVKLIAFYKQPEDKAAFDEHYYNVHVPITEKIPGLQKMKVTKMVGTPTGDEPKFYLMCEMYYENHEALKNGMKSPEGKASAKDVMGFAGKLVSFAIGEEDE